MEVYVLPISWLLQCREGHKISGNHFLTKQNSVEEARAIYLLKIPSLVVANICYANTTVETFPL